ncbi:MAG TPA: hypothetical protein VIG97_07275 [Luteimonas sp.]
MTPIEVTPALCMRCGACCSAVVDGEAVACKHLTADAGGFRCAIYATRPAVCRDYTCVRGGQLSPAVADRVLAAAVAP